MRCAPVVPVPCSAVADRVRDILAAGRATALSSAGELSEARDDELATDVRAARDSG
jgi:hypothetical protein